MIFLMFNQTFCVTLFFCPTTSRSALRSLQRTRETLFAFSRPVVDYDEDDDHHGQTQPSLLFPVDEPELDQRALDQRLPHGGGQERSTSSGQTDGEHVLSLTA